MEEPQSLFDRAMNMWRKIDFPVIEHSGDELQPYLDTLRKNYHNGTVLHHRFSIPEHPDLLDFINNGQLHAAYFFDRFHPTK